MPCNDSTMEKASTSSTSTPVDEDGQLIPFINLMQPTDFPTLNDNGNGDGIPTTWWDVPEDAVSGEHYPQPTITITEKVTVTVTIAPSTLATLPTLGAHIDTATSTVTAAPLGSVCATTGTAVGVPIACTFGTGALMFGFFCWYRHRRSTSDKRHLEAAVAALGYSDNSTDDPTAPLAISRPHGGGGRGGPQPGTVAPPSSLASQPALPHPDLNTRFGRAPVLRLPDDLVDNGQDNESRNTSYIGGYGTMPQTGTNVESESRFNSRANGYVSRRNSNATVVTKNIACGEFIGIENGSSVLFSDNHRTVVYAPPTNENGGVVPVIRGAQTAPLRAIEIAGRGHTSQRASIVEVPEEQESDIRSSSVFSDNQERGDIAELEGSPVPRRFSATSGGKNVERAAVDSDDSEARTLDRNSPVELPTYHPTHELDTDGAAAPASIEQNGYCKQTSDKADIQKVTQDDATKDDGKAD